MKVVALTALLLLVPAYDANVRHARAWLRERTTDHAFRCAHILWDRESSWDPRAHNPQSRAHGIPQALPGSKMRSAERPRWGRRWDDWRTDPLVQIAWGRRYTRSRYGGFCAALRFQSIRGWY